jgi:hypothetical protein
VNPRADRGGEGERSQCTDVTGELDLVGGQQVPAPVVPQQPSLARLPMTPEEVAASYDEAEARNDLDGTCPAKEIATTGGTRVRLLGGPSLLVTLCVSREPHDKGQPRT